MGTGIRLTWECECEGLRIDCMEMEENGNVKIYSRSSLLVTLLRTHVQKMVLSCHLGWMNRRRSCLQKCGSQEHISLITIIFSFNEFAFTVQVKHKINSIQILGYDCIYVFYDWPFPHMCTLQRISLFPF